MLAEIKLPPTLLRYELKYAIPKEMVEPIKHFIAPYCSMDYHSVQSDDHFYSVNSLYFDTLNCEFLEHRLWGKDLRFNMRVRSYEDGDKPPYHLEIKQKVGCGIKKYRASVNGDEWPHILTDPHYTLNLSDPDHNTTNKALFMRIAQSYQIEPKLLIQYRRCAYFSTVDKYARLTMDCDMRYREQNPSTCNRDPYNMVADDTYINYDNETIYAKDSYSEANVVLELKCDIGYVPMWMIDLISHFELNRVGFSKYLHASLVARSDNGTHFMINDRISTVA